MNGADVCEGYMEGERGCDAESGAWVGARDDVCRVVWWKPVDGLFLSGLQGAEFAAGFVRRGGVVAGVRDDIFQEGEIRGGGEGMDFGEQDDDAGCYFYELGNAARYGGGAVDRGSAHFAFEEWRNTAGL